MPFNFIFYNYTLFYFKFQGYAICLLLIGGAYQNGNPVNSSTNGFDGLIDELIIIKGSSSNNNLITLSQPLTNTPTASTFVAQSGQAFQIGTSATSNAEIYTTLSNPTYTRSGNIVTANFSKQNTPITTNYFKGQVTLNVGETLNNFSAITTKQP